MYAILVALFNHSSETPLSLVLPMLGKVNFLAHARQSIQPLQPSQLDQLMMISTTNMANKAQFDQSICTYSNIAIGSSKEVDRLRFTHDPQTFRCLSIFISYVTANYIYAYMYYTKH